MKRLSGGQIGCMMFLLILLVLYLLFVYFERYKLAGLYHLIVKTHDIEIPLVKEEFHFDKEEYERMYEIHPKYRGYYDVVIRFENFDIEEEKIKNNCYGVLEIWYLTKGKVKKKVVVDKFYGYQSTRNYGRWFDSIYLDQFCYYKDIFREDIDSIKIKVNKPMQCFPKSQDKKTYLLIEYNYNL